MTNANIRGYTRKPIWIRLIAIALILAPIGNIVFTIAALDVPLMTWQSWSYWLAYIKPQVWALNVLLFSSGLALMRVRTWTHLFASFTIGVVLIYNIVFWEGLLFLGPIAFGVMLVLSLLAAGILYSREFRKPFHNPRLRWWETSPRYQARLPVSLTHSSEGNMYPGEILDISRSGLFITIENNPDLPIGEEHHVVLPTGIELRGQIVRRTGNGYGLSFVRVGWNQRTQLKAFIEKLSHDPQALLR